MYMDMDMNIFLQNDVQKKTEVKVQNVDSAVQTVGTVPHPVAPSPPLPPYPSTKPASVTISHHDSPSSTPIPTLSSPTLPPSHTHHNTSPTLPSSHTRCGEDASQGADKGSLTTLASFFSGQSLQKSMDEEISRVNTSVLP